MSNGEGREGGLGGPQAQARSTVSAPSAQTQTAPAPGEAGWKPAWLKEQEAPATLKSVLRGAQIDIQLGPLAAEQPRQNAPAGQQENQWIGEQRKATAPARIAVVQEQVARGEPVPDLPGTVQEHGQSSGEFLLQRAQYGTLPVQDSTHAAPVAIKKEGLGSRFKKYAAGVRRSEEVRKKEQEQGLKDQSLR